MKSSPTRKNNNEYGAKYKTIEGEQYRICSKCGKEKLEKEFYDSRPTCKTCRKLDVNYRYARRKEAEIKGNKNGKGKIFYPDGALYIGQLKEGKRHGKGTYIFPDGREEKGSWKNGALEVEQRRLEK